MIKYDEKSMVSKEHANIIAEKLKSLGSKVSKQIEGDLEKDSKEIYLLANLLYLACGGGSYKLDLAQIMSINNDEFCIEESAVIYLFEHSLTRQASI